MYQPHPPQIPVVVIASKPIQASLSLWMFVEFAPGRRFRLSSGRNELWLPPGIYRAQLWSQYTFFRVGEAAIDIDVTRGPVTFFYSAPYTIYGAGAVGFQPTQRGGDTVMWVLAMGVAILMSLMLLIVVL